MNITDACEPVICDFGILHIYWLAIDSLDGLGFRHSVRQVIFLSNNTFRQNVKLSHVCCSFGARDMYSNVTDAWIVLYLCSSSTI
jgi:hypothetical protein